MMMDKVLVLLWTGATLMTSTMVDESNKTLINIPALYPTNITRLSLHHNLIVMNRLDKEALSLYPNLTELDLSHNQIAQLPVEAFLNLSSLESLILKANYLQMVRNESFSGLRKLRRLDLGENPWNCSCLFVSLMKWMNDSGVQTEGPDTVCATPNNMIGRSILDVASACPSMTTALPVTSVPVTTTTATTLTTYTTTATTPAPTPVASRAFTSDQRTTHVESNTTANLISNKDSLAASSRSGQQVPVVSNTWKFLTGVVLIALCTSMFIVCAIKSPSWYKLVFNYRHQRLREVDEPRGFHVGRYSDFSLDTEQTETSAQELDQNPEGVPPEDEDGFIEDGYIQPEDYNDTDEV